MTHKVEQDRYGQLVSPYPCRKELSKGEGVTTTADPPHNPGQGLCMGTSLMPQGEYRCQQRAAHRP